MNSTRSVSTSRAIVLVVCVALALSGYAAAANYQVTVTIKGPWAYTTTDPGHPGRFVLIAPVDVAGHNPPAAYHYSGWAELAQNSTQSSMLDIDKYKAPNASSCKTSAFPATIAKKMLASVMSDTNRRYVVSLPLPDSCVDYGVSDVLTRISTKWWIPPDATTKVTTGNFAVGIELTYTVTSLAGFDLDQVHYSFVGTNQIEIDMSPNGKIPKYCDQDSRHAFGALIKVFSSKDGTNGTFDFYEDFPPFYDRDPTCLALDDQNPNWMGNIALNDLTMPIKNLEAFVKNPQPSEQAKAGEDLKSLENAIRLTPMHGAASLNTELNDLDEFVKAPNSPKMSGKTNIFLKDLEEMKFRLVDDGSGACRKAMISLTVQ